MTGCNNDTVRNLINGSYSVTGENHGKPMWKKDHSGPGVTVLIYYWDERDGPNFNGWWIGPKVGGDQVWSQNENRSAPSPPTLGWKVPWDGPVDATLKVAHAGGAAPVGGKGFPAHGKGAPALPAPGPVNAPPKAISAPPPVTAPGAMGAMAGFKGSKAPGKGTKGKGPPAGKGPAMDPEEMKRRQIEREQEQKKRQEEIKRKREDDEVRRKEHNAVLAVRKAIQKVRTAVPDTYDALRLQLEEALAAQLESLGSQAPKVGQEAEQALHQTQQRLDEMHDRRLQEDNYRELEDRRRKDEVQQAMLLEAEAKAAAEEQQGKLQEAEEVAKQLENGNQDPAKMLIAVEAAVKSIAAARDEAQNVRQAILDKQRGLSENEATRKVKREVIDTAARLGRSVGAFERLLASVSSRRHKEEGKAVALRRLNEKKSEFVKFDLDGDQQLNRSEVEAYAKATLAYELPADVLDAIVKKLDPVTLTKFRPLHQKLYIAKSEILARKARSEEEKRQAALAEMRAAATSVLEKAEDVQKIAESAAIDAEEKMRFLFAERPEASEKIEGTLAEVDALVQKIDEALADSQSHLDDAQRQCDASEDLKMMGFEKTVQRLRAREARVLARRDRLQGNAQSFRDKAVEEMGRGEADEEQGKESQPS